MIHDLQIAFPPQTTLCYYDVKDALGLDYDHPEAGRMMAKLQQVTHAVMITKTQSPQLFPPYSQTWVKGHLY